MVVKYTMSCSLMVSSPRGISVSLPPFDGYHVIGQLRSAQFVERDVQYLGFSRILVPIGIKAPPQNSHHWRTQLMRMGIRSLWRQAFPGRW